MATIRAYTDLSQSKTLSKILPLESADIYYFLDPTPSGNIYHLTIQRVDVGIKNLPQYDEGDIPCWSLTALLSVLPTLDGRNAVLCKDIRYDKWHVCYDSATTISIIDTKRYDNPVDACVEMVELLHKLKML